MKRHCWKCKQMNDQLWRCLQMCMWVKWVVARCYKDENVCLELISLILYPIFLKIQLLWSGIWFVKIDHGESVAKLRPSSPYTWNINLGKDVQKQAGHLAFHLLIVAVSIRLFLLSLTMKSTFIIIIINVTMWQVQVQFKINCWS